MENVKSILLAKERLAYAMMVAGCPESISQRAVAGYYSTYESTLTIPKFYLVRDLLGLGQQDLAKRVFIGEFDEGEVDYLYYCAKQTYPP